MVEPNVGHSREQWPYCAEGECHSIADRRYSWMYGTTNGTHPPQRSVRIYLGNSPDGCGEALCSPHARLKYRWV